MPDSPDVQSDPVVSLSPMCLTSLLQLPIRCPLGRGPAQPLAGRFRPALFTHWGSRLLPLQDPVLADESLGRWLPLRPLTSPIWVALVAILTIANPSRVRHLSSARPLLRTAFQSEDCE